MRRPALWGAKAVPKTVEAEDLVQDALIRTFTFRRRDDVLDLERYVRKVLLNLFVDRARRRGRWRRLVPLLATPTHQDAHEHSDLLDALSRLPARQRACVVLHYYADLPVSEIGEQLGISTGTVKRHLSDARGRLAGQLGYSITDVPATSPTEDGHAAAR